MSSSQVGIKNDAHVEFFHRNKGRIKGRKKNRQQKRLKKKLKQRLNAILIFMISSQSGSLREMKTHQKTSSRSF